MTSPTTAPATGSLRAARPDALSRGDDARLAGLILMAGTVIGALGFLAIAAEVLATTGDARYTSSWWQPLYGVALAGNILIVLGLPAVLAVHSHYSRRLTLVGYVGVFAPLIMLNVAETTIEAFVKPYLVDHGGIPEQTPGGLNAFMMVSILLLIPGCVCLAIAVFRAHVLPLWVGVALLASLVSVFVTHSMPWSMISDFFIFAALFRFGLEATRLAQSTCAVWSSST